MARCVRFLVTLFVLSLHFDVVVCLVAEKVRKTVGELLFLRRKQNSMTELVEQLTCFG